MKKQTLFVIIAILIFFPFTETKAQLPNQQQIEGTNLNQQGPSETSVTCGRKQYTLICNISADSPYLQVLGSKYNDDIQFLPTGSASLTCTSGRLTIVVNRACPNAITLSVYTYGGDDRVDASTLVDASTFDASTLDDASTFDDASTLDENFSVYIEAGAGNDKIRGGNGDDEIMGGGGNDHLWGLGGDDVISGGDGNDRIDCGEGDDTCDGNGGNDEIFDYQGNDDLRGGTENDCIYSMGGTDDIRGNGGDDEISGAGEIRGGSGNDRIMAFYDPPLSTTVFGEGGNDRLYCASFATSECDGGMRDDYLRSDTGGNLDGGPGQDLLFSGGTGEPSAESEDTVVLMSDYNLRGCFEDYCYQSFFTPRFCNLPVWK